MSKLKARPFKVFKVSSLSLKGLKMMWMEVVQVQSSESGDSGGPLLIYGKIAGVTSSGIDDDMGTVSLFVNIRSRYAQRLGSVLLLMFLNLLLITLPLAASFSSFVDKKF